VTLALRERAISELVCVRIEDLGVNWCVWVRGWGWEVASCKLQVAGYNRRYVQLAESYKSQFMIKGF
jgi:hypothetical protein